MIVDQALEEDPIALQRLPIVIIQMIQSYGFSMKFMIAMVMYIKPFDYALRLTKEVRLYAILEEGVLLGAKVDLVYQ